MQAGLHGRVCENHTHVKPMTSKGAMLKLATPTIQDMSALGLDNALFSGEAMRAQDTGPALTKDAT